MNTPGRSPAAVSSPDQRIRVSPSRERWIARDGAQILADSRAALILEEAGYEPVVYFPAGDVNLRLLQETGTRTVCPFKGAAGYLARTRTPAKDIAWRYLRTYDEVAPIAGHVAFMAERVDIHRIEPDDVVGVRGGRPWR